MLEAELTPKIQEWLNTPAASRNIVAGAELLLRVTRNRILHANILRNPAAKGELVAYHLGKILKKRLVDITHAQVDAMMEQVATIEANRGLARQPRTPMQNGRRADHDQLPPEVQHLYVENADLMRRMRETHTRLRLISPLNSTCPDSDRYPLAKALIDYDTRYRNNWNLYDHYVPGTPVASTPLASDPRTDAKNAAKLLNLLLGKYAKTPTEAAAARIRELYAALPAPSEALAAKIAAAGLA